MVLIWIVDHRQLPFSKQDYCRRRPSVPAACVNLYWVAS